MDPIGRTLNSEEQSVLTVLRQQGRDAQDCTAVGVAISLERDAVDVAGVLQRLQKDGLAKNELDAQGEECWTATEAA